jgi:hypothetical protein
MNILVRSVIGLFIYILLLGCSTVSPIITMPTAPTTALVNPATTLTRDAKKTVHIKFTPQPSPTNTPSSNQTFNPLPSTMTPILLPLTSFEQHCITIEDTLPADFLTAGWIVVDKEELNYSELMRFTSKGGEPQPLPGLPKNGSSEISPNGNWLAYYSGDRELYILSSNAKIVASYPMNDQWNRIQNWLGNDRIDFSRIEWMPVAVDIFNPFTGEDRYLTPAFIDIYQYSFEKSGPFRVHTWKLVYDPTLTRVAYMRDNGEWNNPSLVLIDLENNKTLWELSRPSPGEWHMPGWSPDGSLLAAYALNDEVDNDRRFQLFTIDREGNAVQWIDMRTDEIKGNDIRWSPDSRYLAFFGNSIYILDIQERRVFDYCLPVKLDLPIYQPIEIFFWSPDSTQGILQPYGAPAVAIDLESGRAIQLLTDPNLHVVGWMAEP